MKIINYLVNSCKRIGNHGLITGSPLFTNLDHSTGENHSRMLDISYLRFIVIYLLFLVYLFIYIQ